MRRCSSSSAVREMEIKTTGRPHHTLTGMSKNNHACTLAQPGPYWKLARTDSGLCTAAGHINLERLLWKFAAKSLAVLHMNACIHVLKLHGMTTVQKSQIRKQHTCPKTEEGIIWCCFNPWFRKIPRRRKWQATVFSPWESYGQRSLAGYGPWGRKELDMT